MSGVGLVYLLHKVFTGYEIVSEKSEPVHADRRGDILQ